MNLTGELSIGDEWQAIRIIANTQVDPRKAVAELIENSIDAGAHTVVIVREKRKGEMVLRIRDDGRGADHYEDGDKIVRSDDIATNLSRIPTHICDSIKKRLGAQERERNQGEFGIGILGFWTLGETFVLKSRTAGSDTHVLTMERDKRPFKVEKAKEPLDGSGSEVTIRALRDSTKRYLSAQRLGKYLGQELRGRLLETGVHIDIDDRLPGGGKVRVEPLPFSGEPLSEVNEVPTAGGGLLSIELYMNFAPQPSESVGVGLYRRGTRLIANVTALEDLQHAPWTLNVLEGKIDYPLLSTSPGTRTGVATDGRFEDLVAALKTVEPIVAKRIAERQKQLRAERESEFAEYLKNAFRKVFKELPDEYEFFKGPKTQPPPLPKVGPLSKVEIVPGSAAIVCGSHWQFSAEPVDDNDYAVRDGLTFSWKLSPQLGRLDGGDKKSCNVAGNKTGDAILTVEVTQRKQRVRSEAKLRIVESCGELTKVTVLPRVGVVSRGYSRNLTAVCADSADVHMPSPLIQWLCPPSHGTFASITGPKATFQARPDAPLGAVTVKAIAKAGGKRMEGAARIYIMNPERVGEKFPPPFPKPEPLSPWRSRFDALGFQILLNTEHPDYLKSKQQGLEREYVARLYAKELVLLNFSAVGSAAELLDRLVEVETRLLPLLLRELKE